jgi:CheY-like chemotaxis protein
VGLKTVVAKDGKEGVDIVATRKEKGEKPFDLIFMDIHMPVMDGLEAAAIITGLGVKTPIVAVTANIMSSDMEYYKSSGMFDTLGKPFTSSELWKCLVRYIPVESYSTISKQAKSTDDDFMLKQLSLNFIRFNRDMFAEIVSALDDDDIKAAHRLAHALKGNAGQLKKMQLQDAAAEVEEMLKNGENRLEKEQLDFLEAEFISVINDFTPLLDEFEEQKQIKITDEDKIREIFDNLEPLLLNKNPDSGELIVDIHRIEGAELLADRIEDFKFAQALEELNRLKEARGWNE